MAKNIEVGSTSCGVAKDCIVVDEYLVRVGKGKRVKFQNDLDVDVELKFYDADSKGKGSPLTDFCKDQPGGTITIDDGNLYNCKTEADPDDYAYTLEATDHVALDPIIIIEPSTTAFGLSPFLTFAFGVGITVLLAFLFGSKRGSKAG